MHAGRLHAVPLASAGSLVAAATYVLCAVLSAVAPDVYFGLFQSWFHAVSLEPLRLSTQAFDPGRFAAGLVTFSGVAWLTLAATAALYNRLLARPGRAPAAARRLQLRIDGIRCEVPVLEGALMNVPGVVAVYVNPVTEIAYVDCEVGVTKERLAQVVESYGFRA